MLKERIIRALLVVSVLAGFLMIFLSTTAWPGDPHAAYYAPDNDKIFWFIQITDTHIGARGDQDRNNLQWLVTEGKNVVNPAFIMVSGDLTDSTNGNLLGWPTGPYQAEWDEYKDILAGNVDASNYYDFPGNHDAYSDQYFAYYRANSIQGQATGSTQVSWTRQFNFGKYHFLGVNTAGNTGAPFSFSFPWGDPAGLDETELAFIGTELFQHSDSDLTFVFGHHPVTDTGSADDTWLFYGAPEFVSHLDFYAASLYGYGHTHRFSEVLFTGDSYTGFMAGEGVVYLNINSLGKSSDNNFSVIAVDCNGVSTKTQAINSWPLVLITAPLDRYLGGAFNPYVYSVPAAANNPIRALVFDEAAVSVRYRIDGAPEWQGMQQAAGNPRLWEATWDATALAEGEHSIEVQAFGSTIRSDVIRVSVASDNQPPAANDQTVTTSEDTDATITLTASDADGDVLSFEVISPPVSGTLTGGPPNLTYTPGADFNGDDSFTFKAYDGIIHSNEATVSISVTPVNDPPVAVGDAYAVDQENMLSVAAPGVLANDSDIDGDPLAAVLDQGPSHGNLTLNTDGSFQYTPVSGFSGSDSFAYVASDGIEASALVTVIITINPAGGDDTVTILSASYNTKSKKLDVKATSSAQPDAVLTVVDYGVMTFNTSENAYVFNGRGPEPTGGVVTVTSNLGGSDTYNINGGPTNQAPVAYDQSVTVPIDTSTPITLSASDPENDPLTYIVVSQPAHGALTGTAPDMTYTPDQNYNGPDSFTFKANDGAQDSNVATVSITVGSQATDQVTITLAQYKVKAKQLLVEATSSMQPEAILTLEGYGVMAFSAADGKYIYQAKVADPGTSVTVSSSFGGSDTSSIKKN